MRHIIPIFPHQTTPKLADGLGREIGYLRISVIDRCNLRCAYCRPQGDGFNPVQRDELLTFAEIERVVRMAVQLGVSKIRLTGGEPLVRKGVVDLVARIAGITGVKDLALSTNAVLLDTLAQPLKDAGLHRLNISLDSLDAGIFATLTGGNLQEVLNGIDAAQHAGFQPIRLNTVLMRGINDHEVGRLIEFSAKRRLELRFIELMPMCEGLDWQRHYYPIEELLQTTEIAERLHTETSDRPDGSAARYMTVRDSVAYGHDDENTRQYPPTRVGFIEPMSNHFCSSCNRLRLMSDGMLRPCLSADHEIDLRTALRRGCGDDELLNLIRLATYQKQANSTYTYESVGRQRSMIAIGG